MIYDIQNYKGDKFDTVLQHIDRIEQRKMIIHLAYFGTEFKNLVYYVTICHLMIKDSIFI